MLRGPVQDPGSAQGAGDAFLQPEIPPRFQRFLNALLILAVLHFLIQTAICFSCLFLLLPMSFAVSSVIPGTNTIMDPASEKTLPLQRHLGQGAAETTGRARPTAFLPYVQRIEDLAVSMAAAYFLVRVGLVFCNLIFILPLVFFLNEATSS
ncbi:hypothetical protein JRQ81_017051 [Phrynocephalus forsythii]|uniref:Uncharacterized protein n=1 Tax=Phrynocephalus forsythii TaxID=171643 RepID=A0A9Q1B1W5_9SAUR|nr:hypothetical protein JRQ81_017051 [Phrynocephalus forsythii]